MDKVIVKNHLDTNIGKGVFASIDIQKAELIIESYLVKTVPERNKYSLETINGEHILITSPGILVNHSCSPNCTLIENDCGGFNFIASRNILKDEEITFDYESIESEITAFKECLCGSSKCRKIMNIK